MYRKIDENFVWRWEDYIRFKYLRNNENFDFLNSSEQFIEKYGKYWDCDWSLDQINKCRKKQFSKDFCQKYILDSRWSD